VTPITPDLRAAVAGLLGFAATQEQVLLAACSLAETGSPANWAAAPLIAHNNEFKRQQVERLESISRGQEPPEFSEIDHGSPDVYRRYAGEPAMAAADASWQVTGALMCAMAAITDDDLLDPARNPWLRGRQLWLQVIVRGFWHPTGHLADYYLGHGQPDRAVDLGARAVATAASVGAPDPARGMASYNLACAQARAGQADEALAALTEAIARNPDVRANSARDPDLATLRDRGLIAGLAAT
jgi:tetratricopeptide (TPR) repeat protein